MKIRVAYIIGHGHSGSTLLDLMLGTHSTFVSTGEVKHLGAAVHGTKHDLCICGQTISDCPFWQRVLSGAPSPMDDEFLFNRISEVAEAKSLSIVRRISNGSARFWPIQSLTFA